MLEIASQITICLLLAALIGFIIGFIVAKGTTKKPEETNNNIKEKKDVEPTPEPEITEPKATEPKKTVSEVPTIKTTIEEEIEIPTEDATLRAVEALEELDEVVAEEKSNTDKPELLDAAREGTKDSLTQIKGIGPKVEEQLNAAGIYHFSQIANWTEANIQWLEENTTFAHRAKKDLWVNQAKALV